MTGLKQRNARPQKSGAVARLQARVFSRPVRGVSPGWLAAVERGAASLDEARIAALAGAAPPSATPYLDLATKSGSLFDWDIDLAPARHLNWRGFERLVAAGVPMVFAAEINAAGDVMAGQIDLSRDGATFTMGGPDGRLLLVVRDASGVPEDVIAFRLDAPREVARFALLGGCGMLGAWNLPQGGDGGRVAMLETPLDWLVAGGRGICVYDWVQAVGTLCSLGEAVTLDAPPALAAIVRAKIERGGLPLVASAVAEGAKLSLAERIGRGV